MTAFFCVSGCYPARIAPLLDGCLTFPHESVRKCGHSAKPGVRPWLARHVTATPVGELARDVLTMAAAQSAARLRRSRRRGIVLNNGRAIHHNAS